jgi:opacity protein-like surface antigen
MLLVSRMIRLPGGAALRNSIGLLASIVLMLTMASAARSDEAPEAHFVLGLTFGLVVPTGDYSEGFGGGGMGTASVGLTGRRFGGRLLMGSVEPRTRGPTNDLYSARLGSPVEVSQAIVPVELQGIAAFPSQTSRLVVALQAGAGLHSVTVRRKGTDDKLDDFNRFGFSTGAGVRYMVSANKPAVSLGLHGIFHGSGAMRYYTAQLELSFVI